MSEESNNQQRFCTNCGHQVRSNTTFCVNCGASSLPNQGPTEPSSISSGPSPSERFGSMADSLRAGFQKMKARFSTASSNPSGNTWRGTPSRFLSWFRDIPIGAKFALAGFLGILGLIILALLSPVMRVVAIIVFGVSILAMVVRGVQRKSIREWGVIAVASLVFILIFGGVSGIFYGSEDTNVAGSQYDTEETSNPEPVPEPETVIADTQLSEAETDYISWRFEIQTVNGQLYQNQAQLHDLCTEDTSMCSSDISNAMSQNISDATNLRSEAVALTPPNGYEESHEELLSGLDQYRSLLFSFATLTFDESSGEYALEEAKSTFTDSLNSMPPEGEELARAYVDAYVEEN